MAPWSFAWTTEIWELVEDSESEAAVQMKMTSELQLQLQKVVNKVEVENLIIF